MDKREPSHTIENTLQGLFRKLYEFLSSVKLALTLLVVILVCCITGVTVFRGAQAGAAIFSTLWFNALLVLLVVNVACCFFPRMWGRKLTLVSFGMILFHLSFVAMLAGVVYNSQFSFRGSIRLTEGESLPSGEPESYDYEEHGRFFDFSKLKGETTLIKMHKGYTVDGADKGIAYEIAVGKGPKKQQGVLYITRKLEHGGFEYLRDKEGYSILIVLEDNRERSLYGAYVPLQSYKQKDDSYLYMTGTKEGPTTSGFPPEPLKPIVVLQAEYKPSLAKDRDGEAVIQAWRPDQSFSKRSRPDIEGRVRIGKRFKAGEYYLSVREVRYWVGMTVRYEPGKPIVLTSLWTALSGMLVSFIGRVRRAAGRSTA